MAHRRRWKLPPKLLRNALSRNGIRTGTRTFPHSIAVARDNATVLKKLLAMIRSQSQHTLIPPIRLPQTSHQARDLAVHPPDPRVIEPHNFIPLRAQTRCPKIERFQYSFT